MTWTKLQQQFKNLVNRFGGPEKGSSGNISIVYLYSGEVYIELGTYDIPGYQRHHMLGNFPSEAHAMKAVEQELNHMSQIKDC